MKEFYKVPNKQDRKIALGSLPGLPYKVRKSLQSILNQFEPMDKPVEGEWLWQHEQQGQSFDAYKGQMHNVVDEKRNVIYIRPLEKININFLEKLKQYCLCFFYGMKVKIYDKDFSLKNIHQRINPYTEKNQFHARDILESLKKNLPPDAFCMIGVCMTDLYPKQEWNFVFGLASIRERTGVFSFARYDQNFFEAQKYQINYQKIIWRSIGVMTHQITHMFGVRHCIFYKCLMNGSNHLEQAKKKPMQLCVICLRKMQSNINFDILNRYEKIRDYLVESKDERMNKELDRITGFIDKIKANLKV